MPGRHCAVALCKNNSVKCRLKNNDVIFHRFPNNKNLTSKAIREVWIRKCKRKDKFNPDNSQICSIHFCDDAYKRDLQNELCNLPLRRRLKETAVPTLYLGGQEEVVLDSVVQRDARRAKRNQKIEVENILAFTETESEVLPAEEVKNVEESWKTKYEQLLGDHEELKSRYKQEREKSVQTKKILQSKITYYRNKALRRTQQQKYIFKKVFTTNQINLILKKRKRVN